MDRTAPGRENFLATTTASAGYANGRGLAGATAFPYAVSVGWAGGVLQGGEGFLDRRLMEMCLDTVRYT